MFGHTDDQQITDNNFVQGGTTDAPYSENQASSDDGVTQNPISATTVTEPAAQDASSSFSVPSVTPVEPTGTPVVTDDSTLPTPTVDDSQTLADNTTDHSELLDIKQKALQQLSPLVSHLDQTPEDKFKTTMMMIQASDDHALLPEAYKAAQAITDEKARAQALLDVVNEINYFTQGQ